LRHNSRRRHARASAKENPTGRGSTFIVELPLVEGPVERYNRFNGGDAAHADRVRSLLQHLALQAELIAGNHRAAEARLVDATEEEELAVAVLEAAQEEHRAALRHRFHDQHARHHRRAGEVALEELLVGRDVLDADDLLSFLELEDAVDQ